MKNMIIAHNGSVQNIPTIPDDIKAIYKTVWEISQKKVLELAADRGAFICQSQSLNIHLQSPTLGQLTSMHFYGWKRGLKTGMYYLRTRPAAQAIQFTVDQTVLQSAKSQQAKGKQPLTSRNTLSSSDSDSMRVGPTAMNRSSSSYVPSPSSASSTSALSGPLGSTAISSADERTRNAANNDPEFAAALERQRERDKLSCSVENKEACLMCSS